MLNVSLLYHCDNAISICQPYYYYKKGYTGMIADRIKMLRETKNISQAELAKKLGISRSSVNAWELGFSCPSMGYVVEMSNLFHVSTDYLLGQKQNTSIDISGLDEEQVRLVYELVEHFKKEKKKR